MKAKLSKDRRNTLESLSGWVWDTREDRWDEGYRHLVDYSAEKGNCLVPGDFVSSDGFKLGGWLANQKTRRNNIASTQQEMLESLPGWSWDVLKDKWEESYKHLEAYIKATGHCTVPKGFTVESFKLGTWVDVQRRNRERIPVDRKVRLESLPGWSWNPYADLWEEGFSHLENYSQKNGNCRVPVSYICPDSYKLGQWVRTQRVRKDELPFERKIRLESLLNWTWETSRNKQNYDK